MSIIVHLTPGFPIILIRNIQSVYCYFLDGLHRSCQSMVPPPNLNVLFSLCLQDLSYKDKHWHENCFKCSSCQSSLVDKPFASKNEKLFCADCHDENFAARCDGCGNIFRAGESKLLIDFHYIVYWHRRVRVLLFLFSLSVNQKRGCYFRLISEPIHTQAAAMVWH